MQPPYPYQPQPPPSKGTSPLTIVLAIFGGLALLGFGGCVVCVGAVSKRANDVRQERAQATAQAKAVAPPLDVAALMKLNAENEVAAQSQYAGRYFTATGTVGTITALGNYSDVRILDSSKENEIRCRFGPDQQRNIAALRVGGTVSYSGKIEMIFADHITMGDCAVR